MRSVDSVILAFCPETQTVYVMDFKHVDSVILAFCLGLVACNAVAHLSGLCLQVK